MNHPFSTLSLSFLSLCLTIVACLKGYDGVKSRVNCWPTALCSFGAIILYIIMSGNRQKERQKGHFVNTYRYSNMQHQSLSSLLISLLFLVQASYCKNSSQNLKRSHNCGPRLKNKLNFGGLKLFFLMRRETYFRLLVTWTSSDLINLKSIKLSKLLPRRNSSISTPTLNLCQFSALSIYHEKKTHTVRRNLFTT